MSHVFNSSRVLCGAVHLIWGEGKGVDILLWVNLANPLPLSHFLSSLSSIGYQASVAWGLAQIPEGTGS